MWGCVACGGKVSTPEVNRKLVYVGMTRATNYLAVVTREGQPLVADLQMAILYSRFAQILRGFKDCGRVSVAEEVHHDRDPDHSQ